MTAKNIKYIDEHGNTIRLELKPGEIKAIYKERGKKEIAAVIKLTKKDAEG